MSWRHRCGWRHAGLPAHWSVNGWNSTTFVVLTAVCQLKNDYAVSYQLHSQQHITIIWALIIHISCACNLRKKIARSCYGLTLLLLTYSFRAPYSLYRTEEPVWLMSQSYANVRYIFLADLGSVSKWTVFELWEKWSKTWKNSIDIIRADSYVLAWGLRGCKNGPAPFPGRMSYKATKPGLVSVLYLSMRYNYGIVVY